jgi:hypothetical protein
MSAHDGGPAMNPAMNLTQERAAMGQNHLNTRAAHRWLWSLLKGTFTHRSTPLTVLDLLGPAAPAPLRLDLPKPHLSLHPAVPHPRRPPGGSNRVQWASVGGHRWTGGR